MYNYIIKDIVWDCDEQFAYDVNLPTETILMTNLPIPQDEEDDIIANKISDKYGFAIHSFVIADKYESYK